VQGERCSGRTLDLFPSEERRRLVPSFIKTLTCLLRLCRLMCGKSLTFRIPTLSLMTLRPTTGTARSSEVTGAGKAQPFHISGGKAARSDYVTVLMKRSTKREV
jgi:hypothetical protein